MSLGLILGVVFAVLFLLGLIFLYFYCRKYTGKTQKRNQDCEYFQQSAEENGCRSRGRPFETEHTPFKGYSPSTGIHIENEGYTNRQKGKPIETDHTPFEAYSPSSTYNETEENASRSRGRPFETGGYTNRPEGGPIKTEHAPTKGYSPSTSTYNETEFTPTKGYSPSTSTYIETKQIPTKGYGLSTSTYNETGGYTNRPESGPIKNQNLAFYRNEIPSKPNGDYIENILIRWTGNYDLLERNHDYIQWLFPNRELGVNKQATVLNDEEAKEISENPELKERVKRAFEMMLDFYGMRLSKDNQIYLADNHAERLDKLSRWGNHNFLRISRILLALKELGHQDLMLPWMKFLGELIEDDTLEYAQSSFENYWINTLDDADKDKLDEYLLTLD